MESDLVEHASPRATVLVPAAGRGSRMGGTRKQYRMLGGASLLVRTLQVLQASPAIDHIVVAAPESDVDGLTERLGAQDIHKLHALVRGGASRQASVAAALAAVPDGTDIVVVHDAVRPFVPPSCIERVVDTARRGGAASLAVPATDTLRRGRDDVFGETVDRSGLYRMQTPQAFRAAWFREAHRAARAEGYIGTDDVALLQRMGREVTIVAGSPMNIKITTLDDWLLAEALWAMRETNRAEDS
ncbi:MAG: 2-C-methyl-D-erythritol 4-phosphate cytidylyltransferase [Rhodothermales bacterium]